LSFSQDQSYYYIVKFLGDFMLIGFFALTIIMYRRVRFFKHQKLSLIAIFFGLAILSTVANSLTLTDLLLGFRSLFRYYVVYFLSFYYVLDKESFRNLANFIVKSFYIEVVIFAYSYLVQGTTDVLYNNYLPQAIYLNTVFAIILFNYKFSWKNNILMLLLAVQAFLSTSRLAVFGIFLQAAIYFVLYYKKPIFHKAFILITFALISVTVLFVSGLAREIAHTESYEKIMKTRLEASPESNFRLYLLTTFTEKSYRDMNLIGDGPNTFGVQDFHDDYHYRLGFDARTINYAADSHFIILLMQFGYIGLFLYFFILGSIFLTSNKKYKPFLLTYMSFIVLASFALPIFSMRISSFVMFMFMGLARRW